MILEWNKVTWYSKLLAVVLFVITFWIAFCLGIQYQKLNSGNQESKKEYVLSVGNIVAVGDLSLNLESVSDSRCPSDVQCIWEGRADAEITFKKGSISELRQLGTNTGSITFSDYNVSLVEITPYPTSKKQIKQSDYKVKIHIDSL